LSLVQASKAELDASLKQRHVLDLDGALRIVGEAYLGLVLEGVTTLLAILPKRTVEVQGVKKNGVSLSKLMDALADDHATPHRVGRQLLAWFGDVHEREDVWVVNEGAVVRQLGLGMLIANKVCRSWRGLRALLIVL
jgi:sister chromatid cohesion protein DCC1